MSKQTQANVTTENVKVIFRNKIVIGGLPSDWSEERTIDSLSVWGKIKTVDWMKHDIDSATSGQYSYCLVEYLDVDTTQQAVQFWNGRTLGEGNILTARTVTTSAIQLTPGIPVPTTLTTQANTFDAAAKPPALDITNESLNAVNETIASATRAKLQPQQTTKADSMAMPCILNIKLTLRDRCRRRLGWSASFFECVFVEYIKFLELKKVMQDNNATKLSPSLVIDKLWHQHILDTRHYQEDCIAICGAYIHHDADGDRDQHARATRVQTTKISYLERFGVECSGEIWNFGSSMESASLQRGDFGDTEPSVAKRARSSETVSAAKDFAEEPITLYVRDQTGYDPEYKIKPTAKMFKLFAMYAEEKGFDVKSLIFFTDGNRVDGEDTPRMLGLVNHDQIDCMLHQSGC